MTPLQTYSRAEVDQLRCEKAQLQLDLEEITNVNQIIRKERDHAIESLRFQRKEDRISLVRTVLNDGFFILLGMVVVWAARS